MSSRDSVSLSLSSGVNVFDDIKLESYRVRWDMFQGIGEVEFLIDVGYSKVIGLAVAPWLFQFFVNGIEMINGYIDKTTLEYSKTSLRYKLTGRDMMQILVDNYVQVPKVYQASGGQVQYTVTNGNLVRARNTMTNGIANIIEDVWASSQTLTEINRNESTFSENNVAQIFTVSGNGLLTETLSPAFSLPDLDFRWTDAAANAAAKLTTIKKIKSEHAQTLYDFISSMVNPVGVIMYAAPDSQASGTITQPIIIFTKITGSDDDLVSYDMAGNPTQDGDYVICNDQTDNSNIISCEYTQDTTQYYKAIRIVGQADDDGDLRVQDGAFTQTPIPVVAEKIESDSLSTGFMGTPKFKCVNANSMDVSVFTETKQRLIDMELLTQNRKLYKVKYVVSGHSCYVDGSTDQPYFVNRVAHIKDSATGMMGVDMLIYGVEYNGSKTGGMTTTLELCLPGRFDERVKKDYGNMLNSIEEMNEAAQFRASQLNNGGGL